MLAWRTSSASGGSGECVEVAQWESSVLIRDSRIGPGRSSWSTRRNGSGFLSAVATGILASGDLREPDVRLLLLRLASIIAARYGHRGHGFILNLNLKAVSFNPATISGMQARGWKG